MAYTGDVSGAMLAKLGCSYVLAGHSERRQYHGEDDAVVGALEAWIARIAPSESSVGAWETTTASPGPTPSAGQPLADRLASPGASRSESTTLTVAMILRSPCATCTRVWAWNPSERHTWQSRRM